MDKVKNAKQFGEMLQIPRVTCELDDVMQVVFPFAKCMSRVSARTIKQLLKIVRVL